MTKCIKVLIVRLPHKWMPTHTPNDSQRASNEDNLHHAVVERHVIRELIQVPSQEHKRIQLLRLQRDSYSIKNQIHHFAFFPQT